MELLACRAHFRHMSCFGDLRSEKFWSSREALNGHFGGPNFEDIASKFLTLFYTLRDFQWHKDHLDWSSYEEVVPPIS
jgi:hypothetical protein